jgi:hypothetical protein
MVCWNDGTEQGGNSAKLVFDEKSSKLNDPRRAPWVQIYKSNGAQQLVAEKTLLVDIKRTPDNEKCDLIYERAFTGLL